MERHRVSRDAHVVANQPPLARAPKSVLRGHILTGRPGLELIIPRVLFDLDLEVAQRGEQPILETAGLYGNGSRVAQPVGYVWFEDASGMSKATGTMDLASGQFHLTLTSLDGNGPTGEVTGRKDPATGTVTAELDGPACSKLKLGPTDPYVRKANGTD